MKTLNLTIEMSEVLLGLILIICTEAKQFKKVVLLLRSLNVTRVYVQNDVLLLQTAEV